MEATVSTLTTDGPRTLDLDKALQEVEPLAVVFNEVTYDLPTSISSRVILKHIGKLTDDGGIPLDGLADFLSDLLGKDVLEQMLDDGLPYSSLEELLTWMLDAYGVVPKEVEEDGEGPNEEG